MANYIVFPTSTATKLEAALSRFHKHLQYRHGNSPEVEKVALIMKQIKTETAIAEKLMESRSCWTTKTCTRALTGVGILGGAVATLVQIIDFYQDQGETIECIKDYQSFANMVYNSQTDCNLVRIDFNIPNHCRKNLGLQWIKLIGTFMATAMLGLKAIGDYKKDRDEKKQSELLTKLQGKQQLELFENFVKALLDFRINKDRSHFNTCIDSIKELKNEDNYFLSKIGSPELIISFLIEQLNDETLNGKLEEVQKLAKKPRKRRGKKGEGAPSTGQQPNFDPLWRDIQQDLRYNIEYLRIGESFIRSDGKITSDEEMIRKNSVEDEKPMLDLNDPQLGEVRIDIRAPEAAESLGDV